VIVAAVCETSVVTGQDSTRPEPSGGRGGGSHEPAEAGELRFLLHDRSADASLVEFLTASDWPFHPEPRLDPVAVLRRLDDGDFDASEDRECWWAIWGGERVGLVVIFDLGDPTPMFDLRIAAGSRGRGYGTGTVQWLTERVFSTGADKERIEATTRADNWAMRAVLARCGYAKEAHYRQAWSGPGGACDAVGYAILRPDWSTGTTTPVNWDDEPPGRPSSSAG